MQFGTESGFESTLEMTFALLGFCLELTLDTFGTIRSTVGGFFDAKLQGAF